MYFLYSLIIGIYSLLIGVASFFSNKAKLWWNGRTGQYALIKEQLASWDNRKIFWIHAASYGEFEMSWPLINKIKEGHPDAGFVVSFYSPSGYENILLDSAEFIKMYLPADLLFLQNKYIKLIRPHAFFFIKYEFWYNLMRALNTQGVPYFFIGTHIEPRSYIFKLGFGQFKKLIALSKRIFVHSDISKNILEGAGLKNVLVFGDMRIQRAKQNLHKHIEKIQWPDGNNPCIIYGSVSDFELDHILKLVKKLPNCNHIITPHDVEELFFEKIRSKDFEYSRISKSSIASTNLMLIDNYGQLKYYYGQADLAYIGGGFEKGPHNVLEALIFRIPVVIGNNIKKYPLARECQSLSLISVAESPDQLLKLFKKIIREDQGPNMLKLDSFLIEKEARLDLITNELASL